MRLFRFLLAFLALATPAIAEEVVAALSQNRVSITASFDGSEILVFGAIKHERPVSEVTPLDVIITLSGPEEKVIVRRKQRIAGIWINASAVEVDRAPSYYAVSTTGPLANILASTEDLRHKISIPRAIRSVGAPADISDSEDFTKALIRIREADKLYRMQEFETVVFDGTLFRTDFSLPSNLVEGVYTTRIFLTRDKKVVGTFKTFINVRKVGLERWIFNLAHQQPLIYGLLSIFIAIAAGWSASAFFRYIRS